jgi:hypothetical protein
VERGLALEPIEDGSSDRGVLGVGGHGREDKTNVARCGYFRVTERSRSAVGAILISEWAMREEAQRRHPHPRIRWIDDRVPGLAPVAHLGIAFDVILRSAVWVNVALAESARAFRRRPPDRDALVRRACACAARGA